VARGRVIPGVPRGVRGLATLTTSVLLLRCAMAFGQAPTNMTIEVLADVSLEPQSLHDHGEKGRLDYFRSTAASAITVVIKKGQRFKMLKYLGEGSCRIEFEGNTFDLGSCPWLPGFTHHEEDVYRVTQ
jgi:hypothetical protein